MKLIKKLLNRFGWWLIQHSCNHNNSSIFTIDGDDSPRLGCDDCGKDFGYISY